MADDIRTFRVSSWMKNMICKSLKIFHVRKPGVIRWTILGCVTGVLVLGWGDHLRPRPGYGHTHRDTDDHHLTGWSHCNITKVLGVTSTNQSILPAGVRVKM